MSNLSKESMRILLVALKNVSNRPADKQIYKQAGICDNLQAELKRLNFAYPYRLAMEVELVFPHWPKFSGDIVFPVPATWPAFADAGRAYIGTPNKWEGEYGALRYELLYFTIYEFEKLLDTA